MGRAVLADSDGIVGENEGRRQLGQRGEADRRADVIGEDAEGRTAGAEDTVVGDAVADRAHGVLADAEPDITAERVLGGEIALAGEIVFRGTEEIGAAGEELRHGLGHVIDHLAARRAGSVLVVGRERGDLFAEIGRHGGGDAIGEFLGEIRVRLRPCVVGRLPCGEVRGLHGLALREEGFRFLGYEEMLIGRKAESGTGRLDEFRAAFAVRFCGSGHFRDAFPDESLGDDHLRLAVVGCLHVGDGFRDQREVMAIDFHCVPALRFEVLLRALALGDVRHRVEGDIVAVIDEDEVVEAVVAGEGDRLFCDTFLEAAVAMEGDDVVVEKGILGGVEFRGGAFPGNGEADGVGNALSERAGGGLDTGSFMEFRVAGGVGVKLPERGDIVLGNGVSREVQPAVEKHRSVTGGEDEAVAVEPARGVGVELHALAEEDGTDFGAAERESEVAGVTGMDGVHGEAAGFVGGVGKCLVVHSGEDMDRCF